MTTHAGPHVHVEWVPCQRTSSGAATWGWCPEPASFVLVVGCVHEHFTDVTVCAPHSDGLQAQINRGAGWCVACANAGCERCPVRVLRVTDLHAGVTP